MTQTGTTHSTASPAAKGRGLGMVASLVVLVAFFLPWVQACGVEMSGYDIASDQSGFISNNWIYWLTLLAGIGCLLLSLANTGQKPVAQAKLVLAGIGAIPLLNIMANLSQMSGNQGPQAMQAIFDTIRIGGWLTLAGLAGIIISAMMDMDVIPSTELDSS